MVKKFGFRHLAITTCPWIALAAATVGAQEPSLANPPRPADLGYLLGEALSQEAESSPYEDDAEVAAETEAEELTPIALPEAGESPSESASDTPLVGSTRGAEQQPIIHGAAPALVEGAGELGPKIETIRERYANRRVRIEREVTQDALGNYLNHGSWKMWDERGALMAEGRHREGMREGVWNRWHNRQDSKLFAQYPYAQFTPPFISQAEFKDGQLSGAWTIYDGKQRKISQWSFVNGQRHGASTWWHPNGRTLREMSYKDGAIDGDVVEYGDTGQVAKRATFQQGRQLAPRAEHYPDGAKKTQGMYLHAPQVVKTPDDWWNAVPAVFTSVGKDERHGDWVAWYQNGQEQLRGRYQHDREDGTFVWWYPNGQKATEGVYEAGRQQGAWVWWHKNGQKSTEGVYRDGDQVGRWTVWNEQGRVTQASEHVGTEHKTLDASAAPAVEPSLEAAKSANAPSPSGKVDTARAPRLLTPGKGAQR